MTKLLDKRGGKPVDHFAIFDLKRLVSRLRIVPERLNDRLIKLLIARNEAPKTLAAFLQIIALILSWLPPIAAAVKATTFWEDSFVRRMRLAR